MEALDRPQEAAPEPICATRGVRDLLPDVLPAWHAVEAVLRDRCYRYGYSEIRLPLFEPTALFARGIGAQTEVVEKEMYTFCDRSGQSLSLRPEGTAGCVRAAIEHGVLRHHGPQKWWYAGPMFRYERPQKGRYRQLTQWGLECIGFGSMAAEWELLSFGQDLWKQLGLQDTIQLQVNTLGTFESRARYRTALIAFFEGYRARLGSRLDRLAENPLRLLDSKDPEIQALLPEAPRLWDYVDAETRAQFSAMLEGLEALSIPYTVAPYLVRGLDYYVGTVFEWVSLDGGLGASSTVGAGGRYDPLLPALGGEPAPAVGMSFGMDRIVELYGATYMPPVATVLYCVADPALACALSGWAAAARAAFPRARIVQALEPVSMKKIAREARRVGAQWVVFLEAEAWELGKVRIRYLKDPAWQDVYVARGVVWEYLTTEGFIGQ